MHAVCCQRETGKVKFGFMRGVHYGAIGVGNTNWTCNSLVDHMCGDSAEVCGATTVSNGNQIGWNGDGGDLQKR